MTQEWVVPILTNKEIKVLRDEGIPVNKHYSRGSIGFDGIAAIVSDHFDDLEEVRRLYRLLSKKS